MNPFRKYTLAAALALALVAGAAAAGQHSQSQPGPKQRGPAVSVLVDSKQPAPALARQHSARAAAPKTAWRSERTSAKRASFASAQSDDRPPAALVHAGQHSASLAGPKQAN